MLIVRQLQVVERVASGWFLSFISTTYLYRYASQLWYLANRDFMQSAAGASPGRPAVALGRVPCFYLSGTLRNQAGRISGNYKFAVLPCSLGAGLPAGRVPCCNCHYQCLTNWDFEFGRINSIFRFSSPPRSPVIALTAAVLLSKHSGDCGSGAVTHCNTGT